MRSREYKENGNGWRLRAHKKHYDHATYEITSPPKTRMDRYDLAALHLAITRARQAMGESS